MSDPVLQLDTEANTCGVSDEPARKQRKKKDVLWCSTSGEATHEARNAKLIQMAAEAKEHKMSYGQYMLHKLAAE